jgi:lysyl-tRNA synthetase class 2
LGRGNLIELLHKKVSRTAIIDPTFLIEHPTSLSPLVLAYDDNPEVVDRFQLFINGAEIINAYSELVNPIDQKNRLIEQARLKAGGDEEAMFMDNDYITAMEYGMSPISGWGMGIDRVLQVTNS